MAYKCSIWHYITQRANFCCDNVQHQSAKCILGACREYGHKDGRGTESGINFSTLLIVHFRYFSSALTPLIKTMIMLLSCVKAASTLLFFIM